MSRFALALAALSLLAVGCDVENSANVPTHELGVYVEALAQADGVTDVTVRLEVAQGLQKPVRLSGEDTLLARLGNVEVVLVPVEDDFGPGVAYVGTLPGNAEYELVNVRLERSQHADASAVVELPAPIVITGPRGDLNWFWADVTSYVDVDWRGGNYADEVEISYHADCDTGSSDEFMVTRDTGSASVYFSFEDDYSACDFDMTVKRRNIGALRGGWRGDAYGATADWTAFEID